MHKYRNNILPASFSGIFLDTTTTDMMQSRHNDYNYQKLPAIKNILENFPFKQMIFNWNSLSLELKATADYAEFDSTLKQKYLSHYSFETECPFGCFVCNNN